MSDPSPSWACRSHLQHLEAWMVCMCCSAWIQMSGLAVKRCWKWKVKNWKSITKWRSLGADHCRGRAALVVVTLQNRTTQRATRTDTGYHHDWGQRSKYAADRWKCALTCFWWVESSCPPADCWTYWPSLQTSDRKRNAFECKLKKMMQPVCLAKTQTVDNVHFSLCSYLHLWGCMSLICCFLKSRSALSAPARRLTQLLLPV